MISETKNIWSEVSSRIRERVSADGYERWFSGVTASALDADSITLCVPNPIHQFFIESNYLPILEESVRAVIPSVTAVHFSTVSPESDLPARQAPAPRNTKEKPAPGNAAGMNSRNTFDAFVVGSNNQFAHSAALAVAKAPSRTYNPLFIYGGSGLGKTHLLQAIGHHVIAASKPSKVVYLSSEQFTNEFIDAIQHGTLVKFRKKYRNADVLMIDDIQFLAGKERSQEEFFHTFNALHDGHKQVVLSSDRPASEIDTLEQRRYEKFRKMGVFQE